MPLSEKRKTEINLLCHEMVGDVFSFMCNPKYRGPNFSWDSFPEKMAQSCSTVIMASNRIPPGIKEACRDYAARQARSIAALWVMNSTE